MSAKYGESGSDNDKKEGEQQAVLDCIARAQEKAGEDPAEFIRLLNDCYVTKMQASLRLRGTISVRDAVDRSPKSKQMLSDERYLQNARELVRRTQGGTRVVGGRPVPKKQFLDCVAVGNDQGWGCTGTLIAPDVVVTAGHCARFATRVYFGNDVTKPGKIVPVRKSIPHPDYDRASNRDDLMVLLLKQRVENIEPRKLAETALIDAATDGRVVGFGNTDPMGSAGYGIKRQVDVPIASVSCTGKSGDEADAKAFGCHAGLEMVAGKPLLAKDSCTGDSGGPFYLETGNGQWVIAGATSRATNVKEDDCGDGGIYVRLDRYREWLIETSGMVLP